MSSTTSYVTGPNGVGLTQIGAGFSLVGAQSVNAAGQIVGEAGTQASYHAFITEPGGFGLTMLAEPANTLYGYAVAVNNKGEAVGNALLTDGSSASFMTGPNGVGIRILPLASYGSAATGINDLGQVVGTSDGQGFVTGPDGNGSTMLSYANAFVSPISINDNGQIAGNLELANGRSEAFLSSADGKSIVGLGALTDTGESWAAAINASGEVVGASTLTSCGLWPGCPQAHAFLEKDGKMIDLNSLVTLPNAKFFTGAIGINDQGQILAESTAGDFMLTPIPEPQTNALIAIGLGALAIAMRLTWSDGGAGLRAPQFRCDAGSAGAPTMSHALSICSRFT